MFNLINKLAVSVTALTLSLIHASNIDDQLNLSESVKLPNPVFGKDGQDKDSQKFVAQNLENINAYRDFYRKHGDNVLISHQDIMIPYINNLKNEIDKNLLKTGNNINHMQKLIDEIDFIKKQQLVSPNWLLVIHFRYLALLDTPSVQETELFEHTPSHPEIFKSFLEKDIYGNPVTANISQLDEAFLNLTKLLPPLTIGNKINYHSLVQLKDMLMDKLYPVVLYPLLGQSVVNPTFIVNCLVDDIYPIGMPTTSIPNVHGLSTSPLGFAYHDFFHVMLDNKRNALFQYLLIEVNQAYDNGVWVSDITDSITNHTVDKYYLFTNFLKQISELSSKDKKKLAGLFFLMHEFPAYTSDIFQKSNPLDILNIMLKGSLKTLNETGSWDDPIDVLRTNPLNGQTYATDNEIEETAIDQIAQMEELFSFFPSDIFFKYDEQGKFLSLADNTQEKTALKKNWLKINTKLNIIKSQQFIDVDVKFRDGGKEKISFPTLYRKWHNAGTYSGMFKFAGILSELPQISSEMDVPEIRTLAISAIKTRRQQLQNLMESSLKNIVHFLNDGSNTIVENYIKDFTIIDNKIKLLQTQ